ncbi:iron ABC transporter ATP-binding protein [Conyzicola sp.]|uniref:iron ABC transporter ATP-binding protein n=1 Tax=Conyzicola sp. TaxID=1969404 RepID=UPI003989AFAC
MPTIASRVLVTLALAAVLTTAVSACASETDATPSATNTAPTSTSSSTPRLTKTPTPEPTATQSPISVGSPVTIGCNQLLSPDAIYAFNPNFGLSEGYTPEPGSEAATIVEAKGLACGWVNQTSGEVLVVAVANLPTDKLTDLKNNFVTTSNSVPTYGVEGYFEFDGTRGSAEAFTGPYWVSAVSPAFYEPGDAQPIIASALAGLGG